MGLRHSVCARLRAEEGRRGKTAPRTEGEEDGAAETRRALRARRRDGAAKPRRALRARRDGAAKTRRALEALKAVEARGAGA